MGGGRGGLYFSFKSSKIVALMLVNFSVVFGLKVHNIVGFGLQSFRVSTKTIRLLVFVLSCASLSIRL